MPSLFNTMSLAYCVETVKLYLPNTPEDPVSNLCVFLNKNYGYCDNVSHIIMLLELKISSYCGIMVEKKSRSTLMQFRVVLGLSFVSHYT